MNTMSCSKRNPWYRLLWLPLLLCSAGDAHAWGLHTHVWFAQNLLWLVPLADAKMRRAVARYPRLFLAGACLPDLALVGKIAGSDCFETTHDWERALAMLRGADTDPRRVLALGYASHLLSDVFAHNHFVPAHEAVWADLPLLTHAFCEWALDSHLRGQLFATPGELLRSEEAAICAWLEREFSCSGVIARRAIRLLGHGDEFLRRSRLPALAYRTGGLFDRRMHRRFDHYLRQTTRRMVQINRLVAGERPLWVANPERHTARAALAGEKPAQIRLRLPLPHDVFAHTLLKPAML